MKHEVIALPEGAELYPRLWTSQCRQWRIIRCEFDLQFIVQKYKHPNWISKKFFVSWASIGRLYGHTETFATVPSQPIQVGSQDGNAFL